MMNFIFTSEFFKRVITSIALIVCVGGAYLHSVTLFSMALGIMFVLIVGFELSRLLDFSFLPFLFAALIYPGMSILGLIYLNYRFHESDILLPLYPFLCAWTADTFGYIVGKSWGVHKICPTISPGKSWEGLFGSFLGVLFLNILMFPKIEAFKVANLSLVNIFITSILFTVCAFAGGLFVSVLKRRKGLKDAGDVLPGHGGFLDRFDSVFACVLLLWIIIYLI